jgi:hypothetical protein
MLAKSRSDRVIFVENAGELQSRLRSVARQVETTRLLRILSKNDGISFKLGVGYRGDPGLHRYVLAWALKHYSLVRWRDGKSQAWTGVGETMPDWGFVDPGPADWQATRQKLIDNPPVRDKIVVSIRYDRPLPSSNWIEGMCEICRKAKLEPVVATQVRRDAARSKELAMALGASEVEWPENASHSEQEIRLRELYRTAALVVSDRLHVLILGFAEGAVPFNLTEYPDHKTGRHFDVIGYAESAVNCVNASAAEIEGFLADALGRAQEMSTHRNKLDAAIDSLVRDENRLRARSAMPA